MGKEQVGATGGGWTIDELAQRAAEALTAGDVRAPNGRVTVVPDRRVIRWYATIGLLDRPLRTRGRTARYGERHLLQVVAVKRRQAEGRSLAEIQAELAGATDATLRRVAGLLTPATPDTPRSWSPEAPLGATGDQDRDGFWRNLPAVVAGEVPVPPDLPATPAPLYPVALRPGATLLLQAAPAPADLTAIHAAARPLLDLLAARGLLVDPPRGGSL